MSANPVGTAWWGQAGVRTPAVVAARFMDALRQQFLDDAPQESSGDGADHSGAAVHLHWLLFECARTAASLDRQGYLRFLREHAGRTARRLGPYAARRANEAALEETFREVLHELIWPLASSPAGFPFDVATGFLPTPTFGEAVLPVPGHPYSYVLTLNDQAFTFANLIGKAWAQILPLTEEHGAHRLDLDRQGWMAALTLESPGVQRFIEAMLAAKGGRPSRAQQYWPHREWVDLASFIRDAMEYFLVGRGLAHVVLGHVRTAPVGSMPILGRPLHVCEFSQDEVSAADLQSAQWVLGADRFRDGPALAGWSVFLLKYCQLTLDELERQDCRNADGVGIQSVPVAGDTLERLGALIRGMDQTGPAGEGAVHLIRRFSPLCGVMEAHVFNVLGAHA